MKTRMYGYLASGPINPKRLTTMKKHTAKGITSAENKSPSLLAKFAPQKLLGRTKHSNITSYPACEVIKSVCTIEWSSTSNKKNNGEETVRRG
jgi:hypothetical protein